jgi:hypothetical protein
VKKHQIIGSGRVVFVNDFIRDLYRAFNLNYERYVKEDKKENLNVKRNIFYLDSSRCLHSYDDLFQKTCYDIYQEEEK